MAGKREIAIKNLEKGRRPGPGRGKMTPENHAKKMAIKEHLQKYLESGEAAEDFEKMRQKYVDKALKFAYESQYGTPKQAVEHSGEMKLSGVKVVFGDDDVPE